MRRLAARWERASFPFPFLFLLPLIVLSFSRIQVMDDAFISYRYTLNLVRGQGLVHNFGEHVEGMTNLLWTLLLAVPAFLGLRLEHAAVVLGTGFGLLAMVETWRLASRSATASWVAGVGILVLAAHPRFWLVMTNGLEGGLFAWLVVRTLQSAADGSPYRTGVFGGLMFMTRPESVSILLLVALYQLVRPESRSRTLDQVSRQVVLPLLATGLGLVAAVTLFRLQYYGAWIPNTITAKMVPRDQPEVLLENLRLGLLYCARFAAASFPFAFGALLAPALARRNPLVWLYLAVIGAGVLPILVNGGDWMAHYRLIMVYTPVFTVLSIIALDQLAAVVAGSDPPVPRLARIGAWVAVVLLAAGTVFMLSRNRWRASPRFEISVPGTVSCYEALARRLEPVLAPEDVVASEVIGITGVILSETSIHDMLGLTNAHNARHGVYYPRTGKFDHGHFFDHVRPAVFVVHDTQDVSIADIARASGGRLLNEYTTYYVDLPPPCQPHDALPIAIGIRNDRIHSLEPALEGLDLRTPPIG